MRQEQDLTPVKVQSASPRPGPTKGLIGIALLFLAALNAPTQAASSQTSAWVKGEKSRVRLISEGGLTAGAYLLGIEIELEGQALTYWRTPGEAGIAPHFQFTQSKNLADSQVYYPAPRRILEAGIEAWGYQGRVIFPVKIMPQLVAQPVAIDLQLSYAVCENICIPAQAHLQMELSPSTQAQTQTSPLTLAWQNRPLPVSAQDLVSIAPLPSNTPRPQWRVEMKNKDESVEDLFAEGPEGWYFDTARVSDEAFTLTLAEKPAAGSFPINDVVLTLVRPDRSYELRLELTNPR
jgi:DsbC/DsbD-like thiol-disulfide interchange protein